MFDPIDSIEVIIWLLGDHLPLKGASRGSTTITANADGTLASGQAYTAWGETRSGSVSTDRQYTGQISEPQLGIYFYNARYYDPYLARFISPDTLVPQPGNPLAWDRYSYTYNNPIRYNDPSGHISQNEVKDAEKIINSLNAYGVNIFVDWGMKNKKWQDGLWSLSELQMVLDSVRDLAAAMGGIDRFKSNLGDVMISQKAIKYGGLGRAHKVILSSGGFTKWTIVHELVHAWDGANKWNLSKTMSSSLDAGFDHPILHFLFPNDSAYWYDPGQGPPPCGVDEKFNSREDFAEAVTAYVYPRDASAKATRTGWPYKDPARGYDYSAYIDTPRGQYVQALMVANP